MHWPPSSKPASMSRTSAGPGFTEPAVPGCSMPRERRLWGIPACPGVAIGPVFMAEEPVPQITRQRIQAASIEAERARLDEAVARSRKQLHKLRGRLALLPGDTQAEIAPLLDAYLHMLGPSRLLRGAQSRIAERPRGRGDGGLGGSAGGGRRHSGARGRKPGG